MHFRKTFFTVFLTFIIQYLDQIHAEVNSTPWCIVASCAFQIIGFVKWLLLDRRTGYCSWYLNIDLQIGFLIISCSSAIHLRNADSYSSTVETSSVIISVRFCNCFRMLPMNLITQPVTHMSFLNVLNLMQSMIAYSEHTLSQVFPCAVLKKQEVRPTTLTAYLPHRQYFH